MIYNAVSIHQRGVLSMSSLRDAISLAGEHENTDMGDIQIQFGNDLPTLKQLSRKLVETALQRSGGNKTIAARMLGVSRQALSQRLK